MKEGEIKTSGHPKMQALTKPHKYPLLVHFLLQLISRVDGIVIFLLHQINNVWPRQFYSVVQISKEEYVLELVCQVKLTQLFVFEGGHALQDIVIVLVTPEEYNDCVLF